MRLRDYVQVAGPGARLVCVRSARSHVPAAVHAHVLARKGPNRKAPGNTRGTRPGDHAEPPPWGRNRTKVQRSESQYSFNGHPVSPTLAHRLTMTDRFLLDFLRLRVPGLQPQSGKPRHRRLPIWPSTHAASKRLFNSALDLPDPAHRPAFLDRECGDDQELRGAASKNCWPPTISRPARWSGRSRPTLERRRPRKSRRR